MLSEAHPRYRQFPTVNVTGIGHNICQLHSHQFCNKRRAEGLCTIQINITYYIVQKYDPTHTVQNYSNLNDKTILPK